MSTQENESEFEYDILLVVAVEVTLIMASLFISKNERKTLIHARSRLLCKACSIRTFQSIYSICPYENIPADSE